MDSIRSIYDGLAGGRPVSEGIKACMAEAARRKDIAVLAWLNYESADNSSEIDSGDNIRLLSKQLEASGVTGIELEKAVTRLLESYRRRRRTCEGKVISLPIHEIEKLRDGAHERAQALSARIPFVSGMELTRLSGMQARMQEFIADAEAALGATRKALMDFIKERWLVAEVRPKPAAEPQNDVPSIRPPEFEKLTTAAANQAPPPSPSHKLLTPEPKPLAPEPEPLAPEPKPFAPEAASVVKKDAARRAVLLVALNSPHEDAVNAIIEKYGAPILTARSLEEVGNIAEKGVDACMGLVLASVETDADLAQIGYCLGVLNARLGRGNTCLLVEQNEMASRMRVFASEMRLHFYITPEECEELVGLIICR